MKRQLNPNKPFHIADRSVPPYLPRTGPLMRVAAGAIAICFLLSAGTVSAQDFPETISNVQPRMVKINGSGGFRGLEPYQSGIFISEEGHILTVWSYVLDSDAISVTANDGQKFDAKLVGYDPRIEIAVLKIDARGISSFNLDESATAHPGSRILAFSNIYGVATGNEPASVQHGIVSAKTKLAARRGTFDSLYRCEVYIVDAVTNNPGAAGGALTDRKGRLLGLIGKELRDTQTNSWLNFAIPIDQLVASVSKIRSGRMVVQSESSRRKPSEPISTDLIGVVLVPAVVNRTPPFIDRVIPGSEAERAGLVADDLIVEANGQLTPTSKELREQMSHVDRDSTLYLTIQRGNEFMSVEIRLVR